MKGDREGASDAVLEQAAEWYWRIREPDVAADTVTKWKAWLQSSKEHRTAFSCLQETLQQVDSIKVVPWPTEHELLNDAYDGSVPVDEWRPVRKRRSRIEWQEPAGTKRRQWSIAASILLLAAIGATYGRPGLWTGVQTSPDFAIYETQTAEHRDVHLSDGSTVVLGGRSVISAAYTPATRLVVLRHGAAYFDIARDSHRPFVVQAGNRRIAAIGTAFNVNRQGDRVVVTVTEGTVTVTPEEAGGASSGSNRKSDILEEITVARLEAGHQLAYGKRSMTPVTDANSEDAIAWRDGRLKYRGETLHYVVEDLNRYADRPITLADEAVGRLSFTGTVFDKGIDSWLDGLERAFPVEVYRTPESIMIKLKSTDHLREEI